MLDAYIIERIRDPKRPRETGQLPLYIEPPQLDDRAERRDYTEQPDAPKRGIVDIDFSI